MKALDERDQAFELYLHQKHVVEALIRPLEDPNEFKEKKKQRGCLESLIIRYFESNDKKEEKSDDVEKDHQSEDNTKVEDSLSLLEAQLASIFSDTDLKEYLQNVKGKKTEITHEQLIDQRIKKIKELRKSYQDLLEGDF